MDLLLSRCSEAISGLPHPIPFELACGTRRAISHIVEIVPLYRIILSGRFHDEGSTWFQPLYPFFLMIIPHSPSGETGKPSRTINEPIRCCGVKSSISAPQSQLRTLRHPPTGRPCASPAAFPPACVFNVMYVFRHAQAIFSNSGNGDMCTTWSNSELTDGNTDLGKNYSSLVKKYRDVTEIVLKIT